LGPIAQPWLERTPDKREVSGSTPLRPTIVFKHLQPKILLPQNLLPRFYSKNVQKMTLPGGRLGSLSDIQDFIEKLRVGDFPKKFLVEEFDRTVTEFEAACNSKRKPPTLK
jgi:hypothetical protein